MQYRQRQEAPRAFQEEATLDGRRRSLFLFTTVVELTVTRRTLEAGMVCKSVATVESSPQYSHGVERSSAIAFGKWCVVFSQSIFSRLLREWQLPSCDGWTKPALLLCDTTWISFGEARGASQYVLEYAHKI